MFVISSVYHKTRAHIREAIWGRRRRTVSSKNENKINTQTTILTQSIKPTTTTTRQQINSKKQQIKNAKFPAKQKRKKKHNPQQTLCQLQNANFKKKKTKSQSTTN